MSELIPWRANIGYTLFSAKNRVFSKEQAKQAMKIFYDSEFTGLHQHTTLISMGFVAENDVQFYAEFTDFDATQCDEWISNNVLKHTQWLGDKIWLASPVIEVKEGGTRVCGNSAYIKEQLARWLEQFETIEIWSDCYAYDWVLFCELFGGALSIPENIFYMPADLSTMFQLKGLDMDTDREAFCSPALNSGLLEHNARHNALYDAWIIRGCYQQLVAMEDAISVVP